MRRFENVKQQSFEDFGGPSERIGVDEKPSSLWTDYKLEVSVRVD